MIKFFYSTSIKIIKRLIILIVNIVISLLSLFIAKSDRIIVVGGWFGKRYSDNSKYFFLYVNGNRENLGIDKIVWITRSKSIKDELISQGFVAYNVWSLQSIWYHLRAKIHLIDQSIFDINPLFSVRSKRINLWHGFPLKKIGTFMDTSMEHKNIKSNKFINFVNKSTTRGFWGDHYLLATSEFSAKILGQAFNLESKKIIISGYPRNYELIVNNPINYVLETEKGYLNQIKRYKTNGTKLIGYFPTFRDKRETLFFGTNDQSELKDLLDYFLKMNTKIVGKFHFAGENDNFDHIHKHDAFINLPPDVDVYTFLNQIDILITDYSSIYYDFLLLKRPIIFFPYDLQYYREEDRGLIFDYDEYTPGPKAYNLKDLRLILSNGVEEFTEEYRSKYGLQISNLTIKIFNEPNSMKIDHLIKQIRKIT